MNALLWKDYRVNRLVLLTGLVLLMAPLVAFCTLNAVSQWRYGQPIFPWPAALSFASVLSLLLSCITLTLLGGAAFACERCDRSAEFLAGLPATRLQIIGSKVVIAVGAGLVIWAVDLLVFFIIAPYSGEMGTETVENFANFRTKMLPMLAAMSLSMFGAAWFGSSFLPSHNIAAGLAFGFPVLVFGILRTVEFVLEQTEFAVDWLPTVLAVLGLAGFLGGILIYARRVEP